MPADTVGIFKKKFKKYFLSTLWTVKPTMLSAVDVLGKNIKLAEYGDDMNSFLADVKSANNLFQLLEKFSIISGFNVLKKKQRVSC